MEVKPGYKQTEVGVIPEDWVISQLGELIEVKNGFAFSSECFAENGPILLTPGNFKLEGGLHFDERNTKRYSGTYDKSTVFKYGDLLLVMTDLTPDCNLLGKSAFVLVEETILHNQRIGKVTIFGDRLSKNFLYWYFLSPRHAKRMKETATGSTVRHTSNGSIYTTIIALPPTIPEQTAIATALSDVDALVESLEQLIAKKRAIKQGAMQELLTGKRRLPGFGNGKGYKQTEIGTIPEDWKAVSLGAVTESTQLGGNYANSPSPSIWPLIKMGNLGRGSLRLDKIEFIVSSTPPFQKDELEHGDLLLNTRNTLDLVGKVAVWRNELSEAYFNSNIMRIKFKSSFVGSNFFMNLQMNTDHFLKQIRGVAIGTTSVAAVYWRDIRNLLVPLPPLPEQTAIATVLSDMDSEIEALETKLNKTRQIKQGMMSELLTGRIRLI